MSGPPPPKSVLIVRLGAMGDVVHVLPALGLLKGAGVEKVGWLIEDRWSALVEGTAHLGCIHRLPRGRWRREGTGVFGRLGDLRRLRREMRAEGYAAAVDFQGLTKSALGAWFSGARRRIGYGDSDAREMSRFFYSERVKPPPEARHVLERNMSLLAGVGVERPEGELEFGLKPAEDDTERVRAGLAELGIHAGDRIALVQPGAGWPTKRWLPGRFGEAARILRDKHGFKPVITWGGAGERALAEDVRTGSGDAAVIAPDTDIAGLVALVAQAGLFIGGDTGPTHIAAALGVPTVGIYAASDTPRNGPYGPLVETVVSPVECAGCWRRRCDLLPKCMEAIATGQVMYAVEELLARADERDAVLGGGG